MRIALRTSGGRGEYEVAGRHDSIRVQDVFDHHIVIEVIPGLRLPTNNYVRHTQGKPRIRLNDPRVDSHIYLILTSLLLLPKPKREIGATPSGKLQIYKDNFSVLSVPFEVSEIDAAEITISPTQLVLSNSSFDSGRLEIIERMRIVMACWDAASRLDTPLAKALGRHQQSVHDQDLPGIMSAAQDIRVSIREVDDPLRHVIRTIGLENREELMWLGVHTTSVEEALALGEETLEELREAARNRQKTWRLAALRGSAGKSFRLNVKMAYDHTCLFTGIRLPKIPLTGSSGVDAAHILPWAEYELNSISNGLCLSKLCHWAFDSGILMLHFSEKDEKYRVSITEKAEEAESNGLIQLGSFRSIQGVVSSSLLPKSKANWPSAKFLSAFNEASNF